MKILELDSGNTRLKWRVLQNGQPLHRGVLLNTEDWEVSFQSIQREFGTIDQARAAVVSGSDRAEKLGTIIRSLFGIKLELIQIRPEWRGLQLIYDNPLTMGIDRWLAMLTAWDQKTDDVRIIASSGTALTLDIIAPNGKYLGGYIVPGQMLMKKSLLTHTAHLGISYDPIESIDPGHKTMDCINQGILAMSVALISAQAERYDNVTVYLTGGDAPSLQPHIKANTAYLPEMVMDGMALAIREN